jgi:hypothetical protein
VVVAAVVLGLMALMGIFGGLVSMGVCLFGQAALAIHSIASVRAMMEIFAGMMLCFSLFCGWTAVDLFRMRRWARHSILVLGGLEFLFCALLCGVMILVGFKPPPVPEGAASPVSLQAVFIGMAAFYGVLSLIGAWWLVYFNLAPVRTAFAGTGQAAMETEPAASLGVAAQAPAGTPAWRIVIIVWACLMLVSVLYLPVVLFMHLPLFMFGVVFRGTAAAALMLAVVAVQLYLGAGLLRKWKAAWYVALAWQVYTVAVFLSFLLPGVWARLMAYEQEVQGRWGLAFTTSNTTVAIDQRPFMLMGAVVGGIFGAAIVALFTVALFKRREDYLGAS